MTFTTQDIATAAKKIATHVETITDDLTAADAKLGDGDLGLTVSHGWREIVSVSDDLPDDVGMAFMECAKAFQRASSSSFGTLMATGFMSAAKACKGNEAISYGEVAALLEGANAAMMKRGKGNLGEKSILDIIDAMAKAAQGQSTASDILASIDTASQAAMAEYKDKPNKLGRARMFGEKSIGLDDPGMLAFREMVVALLK